jgi:putative membrane protein
MPAAVAYLHFFSMLMLSALLVSQLVLCNRDLQPAHVRVLARVDKLYLAAAIGALLTGVARVLVSGKQPTFYFMNPVFYIKVALFLAVGLISIVPTLQFLRWNRALDAGEGRVLREAEIASTRRYIALEIALLALIPLAAVLMARGVGLQT